MQWAPEKKRGGVLQPGKKGLTGAAAAAARAADVSEVKLSAGDVARHLKFYKHDSPAVAKQKATESLSYRVGVPGYRYVPVPKAWDGVLVPVTSDGNLDATRTPADVIYTDVKKTERVGAPKLTYNQMVGASKFPVRVIRYEWPKSASVPKVAVFKGPVPVGGRSGRLQSAALEAQVEQGRSWAPNKKRKLR